MSKLTNKILASSLILLITSVSWAYIPQFWLIMSRLAENHGRGVYVIDQDVVFNHLQEPVVINEKWTIKDGESMKVRISSKRGLQNFQMTFVYDKNKKYFIDGNGIKKSAPVSKENIEPFFHFRRSKKFKPKMVAMNMVPASALKSKTKHSELKDITHDSEPFVRLSRVRGAISWGIGTPTPVNAKKLPGIWVEQDSFNLLKLRLPSEVEVLAGKYQNYRSKLRLPKKREVSWGDRRATIQVNSVKPLGSGPKARAKTSQKSLDFGKDPSLALKGSSDPVVAEFYKRFR